jgi:hypothetical protein
MSKIQFAIMATLILSIGTLALAPTAIAAVLVVASTAAVLATGVDNRAASRTKLATPSSERGATMVGDRDGPVLLAGPCWGETCTTDEGYGRRVPCGAGP